MKKKQFTIGAAALAAAAVLFTAVPVQTQAAEIKTVVLNGKTCEKLQQKLQECIGSQNCFQWGNVIWNGSCSQLPGVGGNTGDNQETPDTEDTQTPETEDTQTPQQPDADSSQKPQVPDTDESETDAEASFAVQVVNLVNAERAKEGLAALQIDTNMEKAALVRAQEIQTSFSHTRPNGTSFTTALKEAGVTYRGAGENIAWGQKTPEQVVEGWMNSPGHKANIMNKNFTRIGVGHLQNASGVSYWVQLFAY